MTKEEFEQGKALKAEARKKLSEAYKVEVSYEARLKELYKDAYDKEKQLGDIMG